MSGEYGKHLREVVDDVRTEHRITTCPGCRRHVGLIDGACKGCGRVSCVLCRSYLRTTLCDCSAQKAKR